VSQFLAGIDIGTTNIKALVFDQHGRELASSSRPTPTHYPQPRWAYHKPHEIWECTKDVLGEVTSKIGETRRIAGIAVTSMGESGVPLDKDGKATSDIIAWFDGRTASQAEWLEEKIGRERIYELSGVPLRPIFGMCKILWLKENEPEAYARTTSWLNVADYVAYLLSGEMATDYSLASRTLVFDLSKLNWSKTLIEMSGISDGLFPQAVPSGTPLGKVKTDVAVETGLSPETVVSSGGHDHVCGAFAVGAVDPGTLLNSLGTAEALCISGKQPTFNPAVAEQGYTTGAHVAPDRFYVLGGIYTSGGSIEWLKGILGNDLDFGTLISEATDAPPGSLGVCFQPHLRLGNPPHNDPKSRGAFVGLTADVTRGILFRSVLEGLAFECRLSLEALTAHPEIDRPERIIAIGGNTKNRLLMRIKASVLNQPISIAEVEESAALGAAILGGLGAGVYPDATSALAQIQYNTEVVDPDTNLTDLYDLQFKAVYKGLYPALHPLNESLSDQPHLL
jgi:xylulokinase